jgi:predicted nucleic acid-binding protein
MATNPIILIDINVILDVLQTREPFFKSSTQLLALIETEKVDGYISAHSITTLFYLLQKGRSNHEAHAQITKLMQFIKIASVNQQTIEQALNLPYQDFEDAVQMICALQLKADALISRNIKDFQPPLISVLQPVEYLAISQL